MSVAHGQGSSGVLQGGSNSASSVVVHFTQLVTLLLAVVPMNSILKVSATVMADIEDEDVEQQPEASTSNQSSGIVACCGCMSGAHTLHAECMQSSSMLVGTCCMCLPVS